MDTIEDRIERLDRQNRQLKIDILHYEEIVNEVLMNLEIPGGSIDRARSLLHYILSKNNQ